MSYKTWQKDFADWVYRNQALKLKSFPALKLVAGPEETEAAFRARIQLARREARDAMVEKLRRSYGPKLAALEERIRRAQQVVQREEEQAKGQKMQTAISVGATLLGALVGRKVASVGNVGRATTAMRGVGRSINQTGDVARAKETLETVKQAQVELEDEFNAAVAALEAEMGPSRAISRRSRSGPKGRREGTVLGPGVATVPTRHQCWRAAGLALTSETITTTTTGVAVMRETKIQTGALCGR